MSFMDWVGTVAAIWFAVSILVAVVWHRAQKRLNRQPAPPDIVRAYRVRAHRDSNNGGA